MTDYPKKVQESPEPPGSVPARKKIGLKVRPGRFKPARSLMGALLLLLLAVVVAVGATTSSTLISKNENNFDERGNHYSYLSSISYSGRFISFDSEANNLDQDVLDTFSGWDIYLMDRNVNDSVTFDEEGFVEIILVTPGSLGDSRYPVMPRKPGINAATEKRYVVFQSDSSSFNAFNWIPPYDTAWDPGSFRDIFLADLGSFDTLGRLYIYPISCSTTYKIGGVSNGNSGSPGPIPVSLSNPVHAGAVVYLDGSNNPHVVFESRATNLVPGGTNTYQHIYLRDVTEDCGETNSLILLSKNESGNEANGNSTNPVVSSDGRFVAFVSYATNLLEDNNPNGSKAQVYLLDRNYQGTGNPKFYLLSSSQGGNIGNGDSFTPSIGRTDNDKIRVSFSSDSNNLVSGDNNGFRDIFVAEVTPDTEGHTISLVSYGITGAQGNNLSTAPVISGDGLVVSFTSYATNLVFNDNNYDCYDSSGQINCPDVFTRVIDAGPEIIWRTSLTSEGEESQANSGATQLDGSGKYASFVTFANLVGDGEMGIYQQVYVRDHGNPPGNPIISPSSWEFSGLEPGESSTREFTMTFLSGLQIGQIHIEVDQIGERFSIIADNCSNTTFVENQSCTFTVQLTAKPDDPFGSTYRDNVFIPLPADPREYLKLALKGHVSVIMYNPLIMID
jgi:hypothetical protein